MSSKGSRMQTLWKQPYETTDEAQHLSALMVWKSGSKGHLLCADPIDSFNGRLTALSFQ